MLKFCAFIFSFLCLNAHAVVSNTVILSDSLADEGRLYALTQQQKPDPYYYYQGRYSNGPTWPEYAFAQRENFAISGAQSGYSNILEPELGALVDNTGLLGQVDEYIAQHVTVEDNTVFYIGIGGNDVLALDALSEGVLQELVENMLDNIELALTRLEDNGASQFALIGLPDMATTPAVNDLPHVELRLLTLISDRFNDGLKKLAAMHDAQYIDLDKFISSLMKHPHRHGFMNVTDACFDEQTLLTCENPDQYIFWDSVHPTTRVHQLFAESLMGQQGAFISMNE